jgi:selenoprotein W-related protein
MGKLMNEFKQQIPEYTLVPTGGGLFEVEFDGELVYSKKKTGQFPDEDAILALARKRVTAGASA